MATRAFSTGIAWIDTAGDDALVPRLVLRVLEDASLHPVGTFRVATTAILALLWFEMAQMLKHQNRCVVLFGKLDNASTHQMCYLLIAVADFAPEIGIVLFAFSNDASLMSVACNLS